MILQIKVILLIVASVCWAYEGFKAGLSLGENQLKHGIPYPQASHDLLNLEKIEDSIYLSSWADIYYTELSKQPLPIVDLHESSFKPTFSRTTDSDIRSSALTHSDLMENSCHQFNPILRSSFQDQQPFGELNSSNYPINFVSESRKHSPIAVSENHQNFQFGTGSTMGYFSDSHSWGFDLEKLGRSEESQ